MSDQEPRSPRQQKQGNTALGIEGSFPSLLHKMLDEIDEQGRSSVVSWQPHGRCFVVHKRRSFVETVLPLYFRTSKFASFQRQLNLYGFHRITTGQDRGGYYHERFLRGRRDLSKLIVRQQVKGTGPRKPDMPEEEPNFYDMEYMPATGNAEEQKMPPTTLLGGHSTAEASTSLSGLIMESARAPQLPTESTMLASLYPTTASSSFSAFGGTPSILSPLQQYQQELRSAASAQHGFDPVIAALRAASNPYPFPFPPAMPTSSTSTSLFQQHGVDSYAFPSFSLQSLGGYDTSGFAAMPGLASTSQSSLRDLLRRDSLDASIFNIAASQYLVQRRHEELERNPPIQETFGLERRSEGIDPAIPETRSHSPHARSTRSYKDDSPKKAARKRRPRPR